MAQKRKAKRKTKRTVKTRAVEVVAPPPEPEPETAEQAIIHIAQDAVVILRRELAYRAELSMTRPGVISMGDCIALLRLTTDLGAAAMRGDDGDALRANYDRLSPSERVQLAALQMKVDYS